MLYIVNSVVLSRVAYRIQNTKLTNGQCEELTNRYTYLAKNKAQISKSVPNSAFWHNRIYGLKKVVDIQLQQHASIIIRLLNHPDFSKSAFKIILQQLQNKADNGISILRCNPGVYAKDYDKCRLAEILRSCHECGITFSGNVQTEWPRVQSLQGDSINEIITGMSQAAKVKQKMMQLGINTIQQVLNGDGTEGLEWNKIAQHTKKIPRGKEPGWYKVIQNRCKERIMDRDKPNLEQNRAMVHKLGTEEKGWCLTTEGTIGRITRIGSRYRMIQHWNYNARDNKISRCQGCEIHNMSDRVNCTFKRDISTNL